MTAETAIAYGVTVYLLAYLLYLLIKAAGRGGVLYTGDVPYDANHLIFKRRYM